MKFDPEFETKNGTELLPPGWNALNDPSTSNPVYTLIYRLSSSAEPEQAKYLSPFVLLKCWTDKDNSDQFIATLSVCFLWESFPF